ncbi:MAG: glycine cleavage system aminomethyltransferase GcvT [Candidatus Omnitrophota bacterium]|nr:glycine cleavage system aminomethyltransferase GcvT [Candidatus Omnitrophota bacterium]
MSQICRLPLHDTHVRLGARIGAFGSWEVPLYYTSIVQEHEAVRQRAGLFDISHMGEFRVTGNDALGFLQELLPRDVGKMETGQALYMPLLNEDGGIIDDVILYRFEPAHFLLIVNAGNVDKDWSWVESRAAAHKGAAPDFKIQNASADFGLLALQGPGSAAIIEKTLGSTWTDVAYYHFRPFGDGMIARTGYTGEDGFEIMVKKAGLLEMWDRLMAAGRADGLVPAGFGARDTLRLEAGMLLYGHDMEDTTNPLEAGISWAVDLKKASFIGRDALAKQAGKPQAKKLAAFEMIERAIPRQGYELRKGSQTLGHVTSGTFSPTLAKNIGMGYVPPSEAVAGNEIQVVVRQKSIQAKIVKLPFYKRKK